VRRRYGTISLHTSLAYPPHSDARKY
jgi:hypothetical protein